KELFSERNGVSKREKGKCIYNRNDKSSACISDYSYFNLPSRGNIINHPIDVAGALEENHQHLILLSVQVYHNSKAPIRAPLPQRKLQSALRALQGFSVDKSGRPHA
ncbi:16245_t:CDS:2, partial [Dentiscutata heterogama]